MDSTTIRERLSERVDVESYLKAVRYVRDDGREERED